MSKPSHARGSVQPPMDRHIEETLASKAAEVSLSPKVWENIEADMSRSWWDKVRLLSGTRMRLKRNAIVLACCALALTAGITFSFSAEAQALTLKFVQLMGFQTREVPSSDIELTKEQRQQITELIRGNDKLKQYNYMDKNGQETVIDMTTATIKEIKARWFDSERALDFIGENHTMATVVLESNQLPKGKLFTVHVNLTDMQIFGYGVGESVQEFGISILDLSEMPLEEQSDQPLDLQLELQPVQK